MLSMERNTKLVPMFRFTLPLLFLFLLAACGPKKHIAATHANGNPEVIVYLKGEGEDVEKVMEKVYYENGKLEYIGTFKDGVEDGEWIYYYENGTKKFVEHWEEGREHGIHYDYSPDGQVRRELHYDKGQLVKTVDHAATP